MAQRHRKIKEIIAVSCFLFIFLGVSAFSKVFSEDLKSLIDIQFPFGILSYTFLLILGEIFLPGSTLPLLPIAAMLWGSVLSAYATIAGWMISAMIAFALARHYGRPLVRRIISEEEIDKIGHSIPEENLFWSVVLFRVIFPIDLVSYALGLFTNIRWISYFFSTALGVVPYAFLLTRIVVWPRPYRLLAETIGIILTILGYLWIRNRVLLQLENKRIE